MEMNTATRGFGALAHESRLEVFRLLMREGPGGLPAGVLSERTGIAPSTLSFHLTHLERARLLRSWRVQRQIFYAVDIDGTRQLIAFLTEECCGGRPETCAGLIDELMPVDGAEAGDSRAEGTAVAPTDAAITAVAGGASTATAQGSA